MKEKVLDCTTWDNSQIFSSLKDTKIEEIIESSQKRIDVLKVESQFFEMNFNELNINQFDVIKRAQEQVCERHDIIIELKTIMTFCSCITSTNAKNDLAKSLLERINKMISELLKNTVPLLLFIKKADDKKLSEILNHEVVSNMEFSFKRMRMMNDYMLEAGEEQLIQGLSGDGLHAWGTLYNTLAGNLEVKVDEEIMGLAKASSFIRGEDRNKREAAWKGIKTSWETKQESVASVLNAINGWRLEDNKARSKKSELHYLDKSCHQGHITRKTLNSLMETTFENKTVGQRAVKAMAKSYGVKQFGPWDVLSPAPKRNKPSKIYGFKESIDLISEAFSKLTPAMGEFAQMMYKNNWIDAKETEFRSPGAYCTKFPKQREPRVFMTFGGSLGSVITLAHELGHAYHNWVMGDMHILKTQYAMTTAETASIFAENLVRDYLFDQSKNEDEKFEIAWQDAESASAMICNIPARFEFEKSMVEQRIKRPLSVIELKKTMNEAWETWYGDSLSEMDDMMWASKLHFSISEFGFYNYPYLFGYLFSTGIYAMKDNYGNKFNDLYTNILRDTGSMDAVELIKKHFNKSIEEKEFWQNSIDHVEKSVIRFEGLVH